MTIHQTTTLWDVYVPADNASILVFADTEHDALDQAAFATGLHPAECALTR